MESNRGGPLTTFIMTLPMIVVPTIAMLKPADNGAGLLSGLLSASQNASSDESAGDAPEFAGLADDVNSMFFEEESADAPSFGSESGAPGESLMDNDDFDAIFGAELDSHSTSPPPASVTAAASSMSNATEGIDAGRLHAELQNMGVMKTLWFSPDGQRSGFIAFFPGTSDAGSVQYRFEAIAATRDKALNEVVQQAREWQESRR